MLKLIPKDEHAHQSTLDEVLRQGASRLLKLSLEAEIEQYIQDNFEEVDANNRRLVVRNGKSKSRKIMTGAGVLEVEAPRVNDRRAGQKFSSMLLPPYLRKSPNVESLLPILYLKGLSSNGFGRALEAILGEGAKGLSSSTISSLKKQWSKEFEEWKTRKIEKKYIYVWADGVNVKIRLGDDSKLCLLVIIGVTDEGHKELLAVEAGYRESSESWKCVLSSLIDRGFEAPALAIADGALGFWKALEDLEENFKETKHQRCWVHRIANVLDCFPKRLQPQVKALLHDMMNAETKTDAEKTKKRFDNLFSEKYPKASAKLEKTWGKLMTFFDFPAEHWKHIRTSNAIESAFATAKSRTKTTKGAGSSEMAAAMTFKLLAESQKRWRRISAPEKISWITNNLAIEDGVLIDEKSTLQGVAG